MRLDRGEKCLGDELVLLDPLLGGRDPNALVEVVLDGLIELRHSEIMTLRTPCGRLLRNVLLALR